MTLRSTSRILCLVAACALLVLSNSALASVSGVGNTNVDAYFGANSDGNQQFSPGAPGSPTWLPVSSGGPPPYGPALPGVPAPTLGNVANSNANPFASPYTSAFSLGLENSTAKIQAVATNSPLSAIDDAQILLSMVLNQSSTNYVYQQLNYAADFTLTNTPNSAGIVTGVNNGISTRSFFVTGNVGSYVQFGGQMTFWDVASNTNMGTLTFNYYNTTPGPFSQLVTGSGFIGTGPPGYINAPNLLRVEGDFYVIGDPSNINVESVPEPSAGILFGLGLMGVAMCRALRRKARTAA